MTVKLDEEEKNIAAGEKDYEEDHTVLVNEVKNHHWVRSKNLFKSKEYQRQIE